MNEFRITAAYEGDPDVTAAIYERAIKSQFPAYSNEDRNSKKRLKKRKHTGKKTEKKRKHWKTNFAKICDFAR